MGHERNWCSASTGSAGPTASSPQSDSKLLNIAVTPRAMQIRLGFLKAGSKA